MIQLIIQGLILWPAGLLGWQTGFEQLDHSGQSGFKSFVSQPCV
ncbi:uncharacterized protein METZ01_LOCUS515533 [marine metagenome]|uniref:Uncharacterized protein n=1 Tax=marine metagenome TaxID=408172 RepID=A0A383F167_9ZZZZ